MRVILLKAMHSKKRGHRGLGNIGEIVKVANGYARNYLFRQGMACFATPEAEERVKTQRTQLEQAAADELAVARLQGEKLAGLTLQISRKAGIDGLLFGSVTRDHVMKELKTQGFAVEKSQVNLPGGLLKKVGDYPVRVELHPEVVINLTVSVLGEQVQAPVHKT